jgi:hypothetical protein
VTATTLERQFTTPADFRELISPTVFVELVAAVTEKNPDQGFTQALATDAVLGWIGFMYAAGQRPNLALAPSAILDEPWHVALERPDYEDISTGIAGRVVGHVRAHTEDHDHGTTVLLNTIQVFQELDLPFAPELLTNALVHSELRADCTTDPSPTRYLDD